MQCKLIQVRDKGVERRDWRTYVKQGSGEHCNLEIFTGKDARRRPFTLIADAIAMDGKIKPTVIARLYDVQLLGLKRGVLALAGLERVPRFGHGPDRFVAQTWMLTILNGTDLEEMGRFCSPAEMAGRSVPRDI